jgi:sulfur carrier protein ThiS
MRVRLRNPDREVEVAGPKRVKDLLAELDVNPDTVLVIRQATLVTRDQRLDDGDEIEIRPVISGGGA